MLERLASVELELSSHETALALCSLWVSLEVGGPDAAILSSTGNCAANGAGVWTPPLSVFLRHISGGSWLPHVVFAGAFKLLAGLYYAGTVKLTPARDAVPSA